MLHRWDYAWKILCSPEKPWGPWFLRHLIGSHEFEGYTLESAVSADSSCVSGLGNTTVADKIILLRKDDVAKKVHLEFQSTYDATIAFRMLTYGLAQTQAPYRVDTSMEEYLLPASFLINVRGNQLSGKRTRVLHLHMPYADGLQTITVEYPVVDVAIAIPEIVALMQATTIGQRNQIFQSLMEQSVHTTLTSRDFDVFASACYALSVKEVFAEGVPTEVIRKGVQDMEQQFSCYSEVLRHEGHQRGIQEGLQKGFQKGRLEALSSVAKKLMAQFDWTAEQAQAFLKDAEENQSVEGEPGVSSMNLGK